MFDSYCSTNEKKLFTDSIQKIIWLHKLSKDTIHLEGNSIQEIQTIQIELKKRERIPKILEIIDTSIPYTILFHIHFQEESYISTSVKHSNPKNDSLSVIDWTFETDWFKSSENKFLFQLEGSLDAVYHKFCNHLFGNHVSHNSSLEELVEKSKEISHLEKEIQKIRKKMSSCKQFNQKVEWNQKLHEKELRLQKLKG